MDEECAAQGGRQRKFTRIRSNGTCVSSQCMKRLTSKYTCTGNPSLVGISVSMYKSRAA